MNRQEGREVHKVGTSTEWHQDVGRGHAGEQNKKTGEQKRVEKRKKTKH